jgi:phenylalanyl-tRNA synthetase alpha chain
MNNKGHIHPITQVIWKTSEIFKKLGFEVADGPELEDEFHNFDALNIPADHPARDMQDTFWIKTRNYAEQTRSNAENKTRSPLLLRTQTSAIQIRYMETHKPPFKVIVPGEKVFRREATDASHESQFHQNEGLCVDKKVSLADLKGTLNFFMDEFFGTDVKVRFRPSYFPFVEPAVEADISCFKCKGKDEHCSICKGTGWIEILGAGMVHPNVLKTVGIDSKKWKGFAFSFGIDRLAMLKWGIEDIRLFYQSDTRFLSQF